MPKYTRGSDLDLNEPYSGLLDKGAPFRRNIRTKVSMSNSHHGEDRECGGGAPKQQCLHRLHFAFCLAPVVDRDANSPTFGAVVICGERLKVISPQGCAEHPYRAGFNLGIKGARKHRPRYETRWKKIFEDFKTEQEARRNPEVAISPKSDPQISIASVQTQRSRRSQELIENNEQPHPNVANGKMLVPAHCKEEKISSAPAYSQPLLMSRCGLTKEPQSHVHCNEPLALGARTVPVVYNELIRPKGRKSGDLTEIDLMNLEEVELPKATALWLEDGFSGKFDVSNKESEGERGIISAPKNVASNNPIMSRDREDDITPQQHRKDKKRIKKERAAKNRAIDRIKVAKNSANLD